MILVGAVAVSGGFASPEVKKRPCYKHDSTTEVTKKQCLKAYKHQRVRDTMKLPPNPTKADGPKRVPDWQGLSDWVGVSNRVIPSIKMEWLGGILGQHGVAVWGFTNPHGILPILHIGCGQATSGKPYL